jgi:uncharacterized protein YjbI with pentapeptide repeats
MYNQTAHHILQITRSGESAGEYMDLREVNLSEACLSGADLLDDLSKSRLY